MICKKLEWVAIVAKGVEHHRQDLVERTIWTKFLGFLGNLLKLYLDAQSLKFLSAGSTVPERLPTMISSLTCLSLCCITYDLDEMACLFGILRSCPNLSEFVSWSRHEIVNSDRKVVDYLKEPGLMKQRLYQLQSVSLKIFKGSTAELLFVKILLAISPSLEIMCFEKSAALLNSSEWMNISRELIRFSRASPKAEIIFE